MGGLSPYHLLLILVVVLIVVGPGKLPEAGAAIGKSIREFRRSMGDGLVGSDQPDGQAGASAQTSAFAPMPAQSAYAPSQYPPAQYPGAAHPPQYPPAAYPQPQYPPTAYQGGQYPPLVYPQVPSQPAPYPVAAIESPVASPVASPTTASEAQPIPSVPTAEAAN